MNQVEAKRLFEYRDGIIYWKVKTCKRIVVGSVAGSSKGVYSVRTEHHQFISSERQIDTADFIEWADNLEKE